MSSSSLPKQSSAEERPGAPSAVRSINQRRGCGHRVAPRWLARATRSGSTIQASLVIASGSTSAWSSPGVCAVVRATPNVLADAPGWKVQYWIDVDRDDATACAGMDGLKDLT